MKVLLLHKPDDYFNLLDKKIADQLISKNEVPHLIHLFAKEITVFKKEMEVVLRFCKKNSALSFWVSWYKKSSGIYQIYPKTSSVNLPYKIAWLM